MHIPVLFFSSLERKILTFIFKLPNSGTESHGNDEILRSLWIKCRKQMFAGGNHNHLRETNILQTCGICLSHSDKLNVFLVSPLACDLWLS